MQAGEGFAKAFQELRKVLGWIDGVFEAQWITLEAVRRCWRDTIQLTPYVYPSFAYSNNFWDWKHITDIIGTNCETFEGVYGPTCKIESRYLCRVGLNSDSMFGFTVSRHVQGGRANVMPAVLVFEAHRVEACSHLN